LSVFEAGQRLYRSQKCVDAVHLWNGLRLHITYAVWQLTMASRCPGSAKKPASFRTEAVSSWLKCR